MAFQFTPHRPDDKAIPMADLLNPIPRVRLRYRVFSDVAVRFTKQEYGIPMFPTTKNVGPLPNYTLSIAKRICGLHGKTPPTVFRAKRIDAPEYTMMDGRPRKPTLVQHVSLHVIWQLLGIPLWRPRPRKFEIRPSDPDRGIPPGHGHRA